MCCVSRCSPFSSHSTRPGVHPPTSARAPSSKLCPDSSQMEKSEDTGATGSTSTSPLWPLLLAVLVGVAFLLRRVRNFREITTFLEEIWDLA